MSPVLLGARAPQPVTSLPPKQPWSMHGNNPPLNSDCIPATLAKPAHGGMQDAGCSRDLLYPTALLGCCGSGRCSAGMAMAPKQGWHSLVHSCAAGTRSSAFNLPLLPTPVRGGGGMLIKTFKESSQELGSSRVEVTSPTPCSQASEHGPAPSLPLHPSWLRYRAESGQGAHLPHHGMTGGGTALHHAAQTGCFPEDAFPEWEFWQGSGPAPSSWHRGGRLLTITFPPACSHPFPTRNSQEQPTNPKVINRQH